MKHSLWVVALGALCLSTAGIANDNMSLTQFTPRVEPVLVRVDNHGKVVSASPAYSLPPPFARLLQQNIAEMIRGPAIDKRGKPIASQFVLNLAVEATPTASGDYATSFRYVSTQPVPSGNWFWSHEDGYRLALVSQDAAFNGRRERAPRLTRPDWNARQWPPAPVTSPASTPRPVTPPAPMPPGSTMAQPVR